ncbi:uncharacterized protein LOC112510775 isoform X2 [Cynara cardunculus var. scolymus]|uniref:uncharacterized protein LOC112510775 isoform X2 n=1 Tax=Cynara cardunculus var. scolymus TaxID=59895 RepID=UPI000D631563|nr:uncharacterized protein LOC112510775 isoform X2 [Cynara cardunculus var. scolymus]
MDYDCAPVKRRKILTQHLVNHSESNKDPNLLSPNESRTTSLACLDEAHATFCSADIPNAEVVVKQNDTFIDGNESFTEDSEIELSGLEQESNESKNKMVSEGLKLTTNEDSSGKSFATDFAGENSEHAGDTKASANVNVVCDVHTVEGETSAETSSRSHPSTESKMEVIPSLTKLDVTKENASQVRNEDYLSPQILGSCGHSGHLHSRRKLLVLDVNGLLVDIVADPDEAYRASADTIIGSKAVFKRPYCDEFLQFCFERFNVGVWTSRTRRNIERVLDFLIKDSQHQLLFCWELKRLWEKQDPSLPWDRGAYDETNTLLLDDSPYKALRNPPYTAIFPYTYCYRNTQDDGLGPEGDLRNYLERLAASENIQKFIEQNPFGQQPISNNDESWKFYLKVISGSSSEADLAAKSLLLRSRKKLIIIDVSGLLVDVVTLPREGYRADAIQGSKAVYKRPYCDEFLQFCFKRFNVGIWTSTTRFNIERLIDFLMRDTQHKLLFCWDHSHCTDTGFRTVENSCKPLVLKELKRLWEKQDPSLPWRKGEYDESNTLLLEHSPYKALLNPPHTAIFPYPYRYWKIDDNCLGPEGDLRIYLERLAASENVQKFVEENPFGQRPITKKNLSWGFYHKVIRAFSSEPEADASCLLDAQCNNSSEPEADTTTPSVTRTLSVPKADIITASAAQVLSESKADTITASVPLSEPKADTITASAAQTSSEPKADTITASAAQTSSEPKADTITASAAQTSSEPKADIISASVAQTSSEPKADIITASVAQTSSEPKADIITASVAQTISEPEADSLAATQTLLEPSVANTNLSLNPANDGS